MDEKSHSFIEQSGVGHFFAACDSNGLSQVPWRVASMRNSEAKPLLCKGRQYGVSLGHHGLCSLHHFARAIDDTKYFVRGVG